MMKYKFLVEQNYKHYPVGLEDINKAQNDLDIVFPQELLDLYKNVGYGFIKGSRQNINRVMDP
ncbi:SMI1/KNR4 family protein, partial [Listeria booriae]